MGRYGYIGVYEAQFTGQNKPYWDGTDQVVMAQNTQYVISGKWGYIWYIYRGSDCGYIKDTLFGHFALFRQNEILGYWV